MQRPGTGDLRTVIGSRWRLVTSATLGPIGNSQRKFCRFAVGKSCDLDCRNDFSRLSPSTTYHHAQSTPPAAGVPACCLLHMPGESRMPQWLGPANMLCLKKPTSALPRFQTRGLHQVPSLNHGAYFKENGVPELLSPEGYEFSWTQYQSLLVNKLNLLTQGKADPGLLLFGTEYRQELRVTEN